MHTSMFTLFYFIELGGEAYLETEYYKMQLNDHFLKK